MSHVVYSVAVVALMAGVVQCAEAPVEFNREVRPILSDRCFTCHGPDSASRKSPLRLDLEASARAALAGGDLAHSQVYRRITSTDPGVRMPPAYLNRERLSDSEIAILRRWIEQGAKYQPHWSLIPPRRQALPELKDAAWARSPVDRLVGARLEREGLRHAPEADGPTLLRRVTLDLTGLPPTPAETDAFLNDKSARAYENVVDRLLASPRYAERMTIRWLEAARYSDTNGYQSDGPRDMWRWRDWVLDAFRSNMPFDRFTIEQIAGDLLPNATVQQKVATAFNRNHRTSAEGGIVDEEFRVDYVADRAETTSTVWLGLTLGCARCHDHKYDPFTQKEFYQFFAYFNQTPDRGFVYNFGNEPPYIQAPLPDQKAKQEALDAKVAAARARLKALEPPIGDCGQDDWNIRDGLAVDLPNAARFDGKSFRTEKDKVPHFNYQDPYTFAARIKPESPNGAIFSIGEDYLEGQGHYLLLIDGKLRLNATFRYSDLSLRVETADAVPLNRWQHVLVTYDGGMRAGGVHMYIDGREWPLKTVFDYGIWPISTKEPLRIGAGAGLRFTGELAAVRIYNRALTPEEAGVVASEDPIGRIAAMPPAARSAVQQAKLRLCYLDLKAPSQYSQARSELIAAETERAKFSATVPTVMVMEDMPQPRDTFVLRRGAYDAHGDKVQPLTPAALPAFRPDWPANRLGLARWLVDRSNPLTARVTVNRFWQMLFGTGLVKTVEDFGSQGEWPLQQELLDWLAVEFMDSGWNVKSILKTIVMSETYRQSSHVTAELLERDPDNRLLARGPRIRMSPEMIRDQALAVSGLLVERLGGPSVKPYQPPGLWQELFGGKGYEPDKGEGLYRRSLYTYWRRTVAPPSMMNFDSPSREVCVVRETRTNTPLQALNLMNDTIYLEASRKLAERMIREGKGDPLDWGARLVLGRHAKPTELQTLTGATNRFLDYYRGHPADAEKYVRQGDSPRDTSIDVAELAAYTAAANLLLNMDEAVTKQ